MAYPGGSFRKGDPRSALVATIQTRLEEVGCGPVATDGIFGAETESGVRLFQTRRGLRADGVIGPLTWDVLFGESPTVSDQAPTPLLTATLTVALGQNGIRETAGHPNTGPQIDQYLRSVGVGPGHSWCQAFVYWCFNQAAGNAQVSNPCIRTGGVLDHWAKSAAGARVYAKDAFDDPTLIRPGALFIIDHGHGKGHTGLVTRVSAGTLRTIEGNTNEAGSREGDGVYQKTRTIGEINTGFIDYGRPR